MNINSITINRVWHRRLIKQPRDVTPMVGTMVDDMEEYLLQLALPSGDRTHFGFKAWKGTWDDIQVDVTGPCVETKPPGKVQGNKRDHSPQVCIVVISYRIMWVYLALFA